jgi:hypothetical protein
MPETTSQIPTSICQINLIEQIIKVIGKHCNTPTPPKFSLEQIRAAAMHNISILSKYKFNLRRALEANKDSPFGPGKEFKLPDKFFCLHPLWPKMQRILKNGSKWPLTEIRKKERQQEVINALTFGNHKGALAKLELLWKLIGKDMKFGYSFTVPLSNGTLIHSI